MAWLGTWAKRRPLTIDYTKVPAGVTNFPVLVKISAASGINSQNLSDVFTTLGANKLRIAVTEYDGQRQCLVEVARWDATNQIAHLWVRVPNVSNVANTVLYLYYDVGQPDNTQYVGDVGSSIGQQVWDANFVGVWHLDETPVGGAGEFKDSTTHVHHFSSSGTVPPTKGTDFGLMFAGDSYITTPSAPEFSIGNTGFTVSAWMSPAVVDQVTVGNSGFTRWLGKQGSYSSLEWHMEYHNLTQPVVPANSQRHVYNIYDPTGLVNEGSSTQQPVAANAWAYISFGNSGVSLPNPGTPFVYSNAAVSNGTPWGVPMSGYVAGSSPLAIGSGFPSNGDRFNGRIAEVRISNIVRPTAWITASYYGDHDQLMTYGAAETGTGGTLNLTVTPSNTQVVANGTPLVNGANSLAPGVYNYTATLAGYITQTGSFTITNGQSTPLNIVMVSSSGILNMSYSPSTAVFTATPHGGGTFPLSGWKYRIPYTISRTKITAALQNFPALISLSGTSPVFDELTTANRKKIAVTTADGFSQCQVEISTWDSTARNARLWVKIPALSTTADTILYLYFDSTQTDNIAQYVGDTGTLAAQKVWDDNFHGVWHMVEAFSTAGDNYKDSTQYIHHGTFAGTGVLTPAANGAGQQFAGTGHIECADSPNFSIGGRSGTLDFSFMFTPTTQNPFTSDFGYILGKGGLPNYEWAWRLYNMSYASRPQSISLYCWNPNDGIGLGIGSQWYHPSAPIPNGTMVNMHGYFAPSTPTGNTETWHDGIYVGYPQTDYDSAIGQGGAAVYPTDGPAPLWLGGRSSDAQSLTGILGEVRISKVARSQAWISADSESVHNTLMTVGALETSTGNVITLAQGNNTLTPGVYDWSGSATGYTSQTGSFTVTAGQTTPLTVNLILTTPPPVASFNASAVSGSAPLTVNFTNTSTGAITGYAWTFGDGGTSNLQNPSHVYTNGGTYTAVLTVTGPGGNSQASVQITVSSVPAPVASFTADINSGTVPLTVHFTDTSTGSITSRLWDFGDGNTSAVVNPAHTYSAIGTYNVILTETGPGGSNQAFMTITVNQVPAPVAGFIAAPTSGVVPLTVNFTNSSTGNITSYAWTFGDGGTSTLASPSHVYSTPGTFTVTLTVTGPGGSNSSVSTITVNQIPAPVSSFTADVISGVNPLTVNFTDHSTGSITSRAWDFGDGTTSTQTNPVHTFNAIGTFHVTLTVTGPGGSNQSYVNITVAQPPPGANFVMNPSSGMVPLTVQFNDQSTGSITSWAWTFGDGGTSTLQNPSHVFSTAGTFNVTLTVNGPGGSTNITKVLTVAPIPAPVAAITPSVSSGLNPLTVSFTDGSTGQITSRTINYGDGSGTLPLTQTTFSHTFTTAGTFNVVLTAIGPGGSNSATAPIIVIQAPAPVPSFTANPMSGQAPLTVNFLDASAGIITSRSWNFGDGTALSTDTNPVHVFTLSGTYIVQLTVSGPGGSASTNKQITVNAVPAPVAAFTPDVSSGQAPLTVHFTDHSTGQVTTRTWNFGDGTPVEVAAGTYVTHAFSAVGTFTVQLTVEGPGGSNSTTSQITVNQVGAPVANFFSDVTSGEIPLTVQFTNQSTGIITAISWNFGDGATSTDTNPSHQYTVAGLYHVTLTVAGPGGQNVASLDINATVIPAPVANFTVDKTSGTPPLTVSFTDTSENDVTSWLWDFGDGTTDTTANPTHVYSTNGTYTVTLTVTGPGGTNSVSMNITAAPPASPITGLLGIAMMAPLMGSVAPSNQISKKGGLFK